ncbi:VCBS repeat-containing protein [Granulosicoccaceae sp. 1_MG-2023]|nr:VCBS repeat-containing protein [Granulosicoccaceae sp. 1_MG-2023]
MPAAKHALLHTLAALVVPGLSALLIPTTATAADCTARITAAHYDAPTTRYPHGVLGDEIEHGQLTVTTTVSGDCAEKTPKLTAVLPAELVFEDTAPRLWDIDGDALPEVVTVESSQTQGARLTVWSLQNGELARLTSTPFIGQPFRWLAPVGAADLDGDGHIEIAYIDRPHLLKTLRVWRFRDGQLHPVDALPGLANHRIGERTISSSLQYCEGRPTLLTPNGNRSRVMATTLQDNKLRSRDLGPWTSAADVLSPRLCEGIDKQ